MIPLEQRGEHALRIARDFAADPLACEREYERPHALARKLRALGGEAEDHREAVRLYCDLTATPWLDFWSEFVKLYPLVRFPDTGEDTFAWAIEMADRDPIPMPVRPPDPAYGRVGSMAWHLGVRNHPEPFILPVPRLAKLLECSRGTASNILKWLREHDVIVCVDESYVFGRGKGQNKCKLHRLVDEPKSTQAS